MGRSPNQIAVSSDGRYVVVTLNKDDAVAVVDTGKGDVARKIPLGRTPHIALRSRRPGRLYVTSEGDMSSGPPDPKRVWVKSVFLCRHFGALIDITWSRRFLRG